MEHKSMKISGISVSFPCKPYPSQLSMMDRVIKGIDRRQNCLLESPTGSGKSLALLCSSLAWQAEEKVKKEKEEAQIIEKALCTCDCHKEIIAPNNETSKLSAKGETKGERDVGAVKTEGETAICVDDDGDFRSDMYHFNKASSKSDDKNSSRKHITISYEEDQQAAKKEGVSISEDANGRKQEETAGNKISSSSCVLCPCSPDSDSKPTRKLPKIYFGTRTHKQVAQIVRELRKTSYQHVKMTILGSREHTCIHHDVSRMKNKNEGCKELLNGPGCPLKDRAQRYTSHEVIKNQGLDSAWDLEDLIGLCRPKKVCPYFLSRGLKEDADLIICPYNYLVDPLIRDAMQLNLKGHIVIFDEAHNIEDSAREAASQTFAQDSISSAMRDIEALMESHNLADYSKLRHMLKNLDSFMNDNKDKLEQKDFNQSYKIWNGFYIVAQLETLGMGPKQFSDLKTALASIKRDAEDRKDEALRQGVNPDLVEMKPVTQNLLDQIFMIMDYLYRQDLKYVEDYRASLVHSVSYVPKHTEGQWLNARNRGGGRMMPVDNLNLNFWCMNPGVAFSDFSETRSVILTSGTLSPLSSFQSELGVEFKIQLEANHVIKDSQVWVGTLGQGPNGTSLQAVYRNLETYTFQDELGNLVLKVCETVPHGVLCFLPSYKVMEKLCNRWENTGLLGKISQKKVVLCEPRGSDKADFELKMQQFYDAVNGGNSNHPVTEGEEQNTTNGAIMFAVCRGKVSEGLDFADNFARAVISVGIPYPNFKDVQVELKRKYNDEHCQSRSLLSGHAWYEIQAFRALNQALGRCIRHKNDWGALIIVDDRFVKSPQKYCQGLSKWVRSKIRKWDRFYGALDSIKEFVVQSKQREEEYQASDMEKSMLSPPPTPESNKGSFKTSPGFKASPGFKTSPGISTSDTTKAFIPSKPNNVKNFSIFDPMPMKGKFGLQGRGKPGGMNRANNLKPGSSVSYGHEQNSPRSNKHLPPSSHVVTSSLKSSANSSYTSRQSAYGYQTKQNPSTFVMKSDENIAAAPNLHKASSWSNPPSRNVSLNSSEKISVKDVMLRIITDKATPGVSSQVFKIPRHLHPIYGGDLNLPVSNSERFVYVVEPPSVIGRPPMARKIKMNGQEIDALLNVPPMQLVEKGAERSSDRDKGAASKQSAESAHQTQCEIQSLITSHENELSKTSASSTDDDDLNIAGDNSVSGCERISENVQFENTAKFVKPSEGDQKQDGRAANPFLRFCNPPSTDNVNDDVSKEDINKLSVKSADTTPSSSSSPLLFTQELLGVSEESHPLTETPSLCSKKPLFKSKKVMIVPEAEEISNRKADDATPNTAIINSAAENKNEDNISNIRFASSKTDKKISEEQNSDFNDDGEAQNKLIVKRSSRRRRSSSLKLASDKNKRMKTEDCLPAMEEKQTDSSSCCTFSCITCDCRIFDDVSVSGFLQQKASPPFLCQDVEEDNQKSGCFFFHSSSPVASNLEPLPQGLPGLSLKYIEREEICVQFLYCIHCLKEWKSEKSESPTPLGAQVQLAAGASARFRKGQLWLFVHSVDHKIKK